MSNKPVLTVRDGTLKVTVWAVDGKNNSVFYTSTLTKGYKDQAGEWQDTTNLNTDDLLKVSRLMQKTYDAIKDLEAQNSSYQRG